MSHASLSESQTSETPTSSTSDEMMRSPARTAEQDEAVRKTHYAKLLAEDAEIPTTASGIASSNSGLGYLTMAASFGDQIPEQGSHVKFARELRKQAGLLERSAPYDFNHQNARVKRDGSYGPQQQMDQQKPESIRTWNQSESIGKG